MTSMKKLCGLLLLGSLSLAPAAVAGPRPVDANVVPGQYIVVYKHSAEAVGAETNARERRLGFESRLRYRHAVKGFAGALSPGQVRALRRDPEVAYVAPDRTVRASSLVPLLPGDKVPTGPRRIGAATPSTVEHASGAAVAVVDSGVDLQHPDLNVSHGVNCISPGASSDDDGGHGTHVAGTIAAKNSGSGVTGVAPGTKIWSVKVLDASGSGPWSAIICGIDWVTANAATKNIKVMNLSLGGSGDPVGSCGLTTDPMHQAICRAAAADVLSVVAAGNEGWDFDYTLQPDVPAAYPEVLTVTAIADSDGRSGGIGGAPSCAAGEDDDFPATFSSFAGTSGGAAHTIAAPGVCITSTWPTNLASSGYATTSGTSMAAPHMAGIAALCENHAGWGGACAGKTPAQVIANLRSKAETYTLTNRSYGFDLDPAHGPLADIFFGYLIRAFDTVAPDTSISSAPSETTRLTDASFQFASTEAGSRFECSLDSSGWTPCAAAQQVPGLSDGTHTLWVRAIDASGNGDLSPASRTWTVDATAPDTSIDSAPAARTGSRSARFSFSASEPGAWLACKLDDGNWAQCSSPRELSRLTDGEHTLLVAAVDAVGNVDSTPAGHEWTVMPSVDRIRSRLVSDLASRVKVKRGRFKVKGIETLVAGKLSVVAKGIAKGRRTVSRPGRHAVKLELTRRGRRALQTDPKARITLRIKFRDELGRRITAKRSIGLRG